jgi:NAD(P)-dependent dehydrogenase (short-subunit alcohol dehydrogenase family)
VPSKGIVAGAGSAPNNKPRLMGGSSMDYGLRGRRALVTGGATGIGRAIAKAFVDEGATVTVSGLNDEEVQAAREALGPACDGIAGDLTKLGEDRRLADFAERQGPVDFLVNNIGIFEVRDFFQTSDEQWFRYFDVNVMTAIRMSRLLLKGMLDRNGGGIVFISSESGVKPQPWMVHYGAMKTCLLGVSRALAELTKGTRVTVNSILPGPTNTEAVRRYHEEIAKDAGITREKVLADYFDQTEPTSLIRRLIEPEEIARSVIHLIASPSLNGMAMRAEGGTIRSAF